MAGRIQLTTKGVQDIYFTEEPDYSHFVQLFKRHTNYTTQFVNINIDGKAEFGKTVRVTIPKDQGDMIKTLSLDVELNPFEDADTTRIGYVESIGHAMIEYVDMYIGDEKIQHIPSDYLQIYSEHAYTQTKQKALEKLIGKYPDRTSDVPVGSGVILGHLGPATTRRKLFIDIPFYFYQRPELAVPLCTMCYQEVTIEIKFRDIRNCVVKTDPPVDDTVQTVTLDYEVESSEILTSNIMVVSNDGLSFASNVNNSIEITGKTTFAGDGIVSPAMNIIVNSSGIYRYEGDQWVQKSSDSVSGEVQFSDDGNVIAQIGLGLWEWNGVGYDFRSVPSIAAISRDGSSYALDNPSSVEVITLSTGVRVGEFIVKDVLDVTHKIRLSFDGSKLFIARDGTVFVYVYTGAWLRYGQDINAYETDEIAITSSGTSFFVYNVNEIYTIGEDEKSGVGILYTYDINTSQWIEVYRYRGVGGEYVSLDDSSIILSIKRSSTETDYIKLRQITRSVENYDDIIIRGVEDIADIGSNVYGVGYQALGTSVREAEIFNKDTTYSLNDTGFIDGPISDIVISNNGHTYSTRVGAFARIYTRSSDISSFNEPRDSTNPNGIFSIQGGGAVSIDEIVVSGLGNYISIIDKSARRIFTYTIVDSRKYKNIFYEDINTPNFYSYIDGENIQFSDDETQMVVYDDSIRVYSITGSLVKTIEETSFSFPIYAVSRNLTQFIKYDTSSEIFRVYAIKENDTIVSSLPFTTFSNVLAFSFSKDGNTFAIVTSTFTYIYTYDGNGWNFKSSLFVGLGTFKKFAMSDDGNTLSYVSSESPPDRTIIVIYTYEDLTWKRIVQENDTSTTSTEGIGHVSQNSHFFVSLYNFNASFPFRSIRIKQIIKQQETIVVNVDQEFSILYPDQVRSCKLCMEVVFLDEYEREAVKRSSRDYVITQLQRSVYTLPKGIETHKVRTNFINPVKELFFLIRRVNNKQYDDFVSPFDYDNDALTSENKLVFYENLKSLELTLNDTQVLDKDTGNFVFLKAIQPAIHHSKTPLIRRFYSYSFACEPEQYYPTGQVNFSLINNQLITVNLTENTTTDRTMDVYALSYNVLRVHKGMIRMLFNAT
jgi:hypothetical protein